MTIESTSAIAATPSSKASASTWTLDAGGGAPPATNSTPCGATFANTYAAADGTTAAGAMVATSTHESPASGALATWLEDERQLQLAMNRVLDGSASSPQDLIRLQALVAGASLRIETATRVVDRCVQSLKQLTQQQI